jgi:hypothetical protein
MSSRLSSTIAAAGAVASAGFAVSSGFVAAKRSPLGGTGVLVAAVFPMRAVA